MHRNHHHVFERRGAPGGIARGLLSIVAAAALTLAVVVPASAAGGGSAKHRHGSRGVRVHRGQHSAKRRDARRHAKRAGKDEKTPGAATGLGQLTGLLPRDHLTEESAIQVNLSNPFRRPATWPAGRSGRTRSDS